MQNLTPAQSDAWSLMEGYCDAALASKKDHVADLLDCDPSDVDAALADIGMERCGECGVWHSQSECDIPHPDDASLNICHSCAGHLGVEF